MCSTCPSTLTKIAQGWIIVPEREHHDLRGYVVSIPKGTLGARGGGLGWYITSTSQGHGQSTRQKPTWYISSPFRMFPVPGSGNGQYICSVPGHVTGMIPSGTPWENPQFSQRKYPEFTRVAHSEFPLRCSQQCDHSVPSQ